MSTKISQAVADLQPEPALVTSLPTRAAPAAADHAIARNPGMPLDLGWLEAMRHVNRSALERRVASLTKRRSIKADNQAAWLLRAISLMDLTTLNSNDTDWGSVRLTSAQPQFASIIPSSGLLSRR